MKKKITTKREKILIKVAGYHAMDPEMDNAFSILYAGFLTSPTDDVDVLVSRYFPEFEAAANAYFTRHPIINPVQEHFINNLTPIWNAFRTISRLGPAQLFWEHVYSLILRLESHFQKRIHKGSIYYFWGGTAILNGELEKGYVLMHSALIEDAETHKNPHPNTPAYRFVFLDYSDQQHFADLLLAQGQVLESFLPYYIAQSASGLNGPSIRNRFLVAHPRTEAVLLLAYTIARIEQQRRHHLPDAPNNAFAGILDLNMLFDIILVIDSSIQAKANVGWQFFDLARHLSDVAGLDLTEPRLKRINSERKKDGNFANVVNALLDGTFPMPNGGSLSRLASDIAIAFCIRNHAAHNIASRSLVPARSPELLQALFNVLFLTADFIYR